MAMYIYRGRNAPETSHLFFANDNLLFLEAIQQASMELKAILLRYKALLG